MKTKLFSLLTASVLIFMTFSLAACTGKDKGTTDAPETTESTTAWSAGEEWSYITKKRAMTVGYIPSEPMYYTDKKGVLVGFDAEIARIVCSQLEINAVFMVVDEASAVKMLKSKEIDCIWGGFTVPKKSAEGLAFSKGYMINRQVVVVDKDNAEKYTTAASLKKASFTAAKGSDGEKLAAAKKLSGSYQASASQKDALLSVVNGKADAAVVDSVMANYLINTDKKYAGLKILDAKTVPLGDGVNFTVAFRSSGTVEVKKVNKAFDTLYDEGLLSSVAEKYGLKDCLGLFK